MATGLKTSLHEVKIRVLGCIVIIMLSLDWLNPIKIIGSLLNFEGNFEDALACVALLTFFAIVYSNGKQIAYYAVRIFFHSILNIFFSSIEVLGKENIPTHGPIIFSGNHMNQFVDGAVALITCPHKINFLVAASSFSQFIIGDFARLIGALPVSRPIDIAKKGVGKICFDGLTMLGQDTTFTSLDIRDKLRPGAGSNIYKVVEIISDTEARLTIEKGDPNPMEDEICQGRGKWVTYDILGFVDQRETFRDVNASLSKGENLIIFPEGGSHDNSDLLPLKVGIASIAFGTLEDRDVNVRIVPVGLNYFRGHRFRGRVVVEYGEPIHITKALATQFKQSKRDAYQSLLSEVEDGMRSVLVTADDYDSLKLVHTTRRLYQRATAGISTKQKQDLARRFAMAQRLLKEKYGSLLPQDLQDLQTALEDYQNTLSTWGIYDYQVQNLDIPFSKLLYTFFHGIFIALIASVPSIVLNMPVGLGAKIWAERYQKVALAKSRVKIAATDVLLSKKIVFSIAAVPVLWITYAVLLYFFSGLEVRTIVMLFLACPLFSYIAIRSIEAGMVDLKDLRPAFLRLLPSFRVEAKKIPEVRMRLQKQVRAMVRKYGPKMGALYHDETNNWEKQVRSMTKVGSEQILTNLVKDAECENDGSAPREGREGERVPTGLRGKKDE